MVPSSLEIKQMQKRVKIVENVIKRNRTRKKIGTKAKSLIHCKKRFLINATPNGE